MKVADGFNDKETEIKIYVQDSGRIELWINQTGIEDGKQETLSYMSPTELRDLLEEVQSAGAKLFGIAQ